MKKVKPLHNDPEVIDPSDLSLRMRGSVEIDGKDHGTWEQHVDGTWTATLTDGEKVSFHADARDRLIDLIFEHVRA